MEKHCSYGSCQALVTCGFMILGLFSAAFANDSERVDSLKQVMVTAKNDTVVVNALIAWDYIIYRTDPDMDLTLNQKIDSVCEANLAKTLPEIEQTYFKQKRAFALNGIGLILRNRGDHEGAIDYFNQGLVIAKQVNDVSRVMKCLGNLASCYQVQGDYESALAYFQQSLEYSKEKEFTKGIGVSLMRIGGIYELVGDYGNALNYYQQSLEIHRNGGAKNDIPSALANIATIYRKQGVNNKAIILYTEALTLYEEANDLRQMSHVMLDIAGIYRNQDDLTKALEYLEKSLKVKETIKDLFGMSDVLLVMGAVQLSVGDSAMAINHYKRALKIKESINDKAGMANAFTQIGVLYMSYGLYDEALTRMRDALKTREFIGDEVGVARSYVLLSELHYKLGNYITATEEGEQAIQKAQEMGDVQLIADASAILHKIYRARNMPKEALEMFELTRHLNDSIKSESNQREVLRQEYKYQYEKEALTDSLQFAKKEAVMTERSEKQQLGLFAAGSGLLLVLALAFAIYSGKKKSDELLLNILPEEIAQELKQKGHSDAKLIDEVTVLFTDFKGFTALSEQVTPKELVKDLHECFSAFDRICEKYGIEKIKTIGDAYMAAGGLPSPNITHAQDVVKAAMEMAQVIEEGKAKKIEQGLPFFEIRIGVHTGPVVAGIVGVKKFQYDIWGDTVNTASRMESSGEVGKVNISQTTYELVKDQFACEHRGKVAAKGKGEIDMYFVEKG